MKTIHRWSCWLELQLLPISLPAHAGSLEELSAPADEGSVMLTRYPAERTGQRPVVLVLHGASWNGTQPSRLRPDRRSTAQTEFLSECELLHIRKL